jgi:hypothetical protein
MTTKKKRPAPLGHRPMKVFRRGCLKGTLYLPFVAILCKCEENVRSCKKCTCMIYSETWRGGSNAPAAAADRG